MLLAVAGGARAPFQLVTLAGTSSQTSLTINPKRISYVANLIWLCSILGAY